MERSTYLGMKKVLPLLVTTLLLAGCARHYDMTLVNGVRVTNVTKPILDPESGMFTYKDVAGTVRHVSQARVLEIKPHSRQIDPVAPNSR
jgi:uncharacterized lipoprotein YajG